MRPTHEMLWRRDHEDGERLYGDGQDAEAEAKLRSALRHARSAGITDARLACTLYRLANLAERRGGRAEALRLYKRALEAEEGALGADHPYVAMVLRGYAACLRRAGRAGPATALLERANAIWSGGAVDRVGSWRPAA